jgi:hypothetical protein
MRLREPNPDWKATKHVASNTGLTTFDDFWGALRPKNHQTSLVFRSQCVSPKIEI